MISMLYSLASNSRQIFKNALLCFQAASHKEILTAHIYLLFTMLQTAGSEINLLQGMKAASLVLADLDK